LLLPAVGFGRIGRNFMRCLETRGQDTLLDVVAINDSGGVKQVKRWAMRGACGCVWVLCLWLWLFLGGCLPVFDRLGGTRGALACGWCSVDMG
jgi:hypothetical protein